MLALAYGESAAAVYSSTFDIAQSPLSEGGAWTNGGTDALDWTDVVTANGRACGTHGGIGYDDSFAHLSGFAPDHSIEATIYRTGSFTANQEVELHLRWASGPHLARGYEVLWPVDNYAGQIMRWNGGLGDFTPLASFDARRVPQDGDVLKAEIVGDTIHVYLNGVQLSTTPSTVRDGTWTDGNPGIGFFTRNPDQNLNFCFTSVLAQDGSLGHQPSPAGGRRERPRYPTAR